jgi:uncharacterized RDD family membrane protein YckC
MLNEILKWALLVLIFLVVLPIVATAGVLVLTLMVGVMLMVLGVSLFVFIGATLYEWGYRVVGWFGRTAGCK